MSNIFSQLNQAATQQREQLAKMRQQREISDSPLLSSSADENQSEPKESSEDAEESVEPNSKKQPQKTNSKSPTRQKSSSRTTKRGRKSKREQSGKTELTSFQAEMQGVVEAKRELVRCSFNIYIDQVDGLHQIQKEYESKTGNKLDKSRMMREILDKLIGSEDM